MSKFEELCDICQKAVRKQDREVQYTNLMKSFISGLTAWLECPPGFVRLVPDDGDGQRQAGDGGEARQFQLEFTFFEGRNKLRRNYVTMALAIRWEEEKPLVLKIGKSGREFTINNFHRDEVTPIYEYIYEKIREWYEGYPTQSVEASGQGPDI